MAKTKKVVVEMTSDISGEEAQQSILFGVNDARYEIDLTNDEAEAFLEVLQPYITVAKVLVRQTSHREPSQERAEIREWATALGIEIPQRGRIKTAVLQQFEAAKAAGWQPSRRSGDVAATPEDAEGETREPALVG